MRSNLYQPPLAIQNRKPILPGDKKPPMFGNRKPAKPPTNYLSGNFKP